jgi:uncharacterized protein
MDEPAGQMIKVEVACATRCRQLVIPVLLPGGASIADAIQKSGILSIFPEIPVAEIRVGVYGVPRDLKSELGQGDRVEIYRPLIADPKGTRRRREQRLNTQRSACDQR